MKRKRKRKKEEDDREIYLKNYFTTLEYFINIIIFFNGII